MKPTWTTRRGERVFGTEIDASQIGKWEPTVTQVRDVVLARLITGPDFAQMPLLPEAKMFAPTQREVELVNELSHEAVTAGRMIDFGLLPNEVIKLGGNRGGPVWQQGGLGQPFSDPWMLYHTWEGGVAVYMVNPYENGDAEVAELQPVIAGGERMLILQDRGKFMRESGTAMQPKKYYCSVAPAQIRFIDHPKLQAEANNGGTPSSAAAGNIGDPLMAALMILNTRNVTRETVMVGARLQVARRRSGKLPIPPYDRVDTTQYVTAILARGHRARGADKGGTHSSPIPHLRMGHPRQYATGRSIFIRDTLVNVTDEQRAAFQRTRSHYTVQQ
jgi:hypothetical protein